MKDIKCPYCGYEQDIDQCDGHGTEEDVVYEEECYECEKTFTFTVSWSCSFYPAKADCLNGGEHKWKPSKTYPVELTRMRCTDCDHDRQPTENEMSEILKSR